MKLKQEARGYAHLNSKITGKHCLFRGSVSLFFLRESAVICIEISLPIRVAHEAGETNDRSPYASVGSKS